MTPSTQHIACLGECMVEFFDSGNNCWRRGFAGDSLNVAWAMRALLPPAWQVDYITRVGQDSVSADMLSFLTQAQIGINSISRDPERTVGLYTIKTDEHGERSFDYWRSLSAARLLADDKARLAQVLSASSWLYLSGISAAIIGAQGRDNLLQVVAELRTHGLKIAYDPNYRSRLWGDIATMQAFTRQMVAISDVVLPTFDDEVNSFGDASPAATVQRLLDWGAGLAVVKNGTQPTLTGTADGSNEWPLTLTQKPVDTTGAGDSFNGGFLAAYIQGESLAAAVARGQQIAAKVVMERGALVAYDTLRASTPR